MLIISDNYRTGFAIRKVAILSVVTYNNLQETNTQYTPPTPTPTRLNCRVASCRRCVHTVGCRDSVYNSAAYRLYVTGAENWKLGHD